MKWLRIVVAGLLPSALGFSPRGDDVPEVTVKEHKAPYKGIRYFDDSDVVLAVDGNSLRISTDNGRSFHDAGDVSKAQIAGFQMDKFVKTRAFVFDLDGNGWVTNDRGDHWDKFSGLIGEDYKLGSVPKVKLHAQDPKYALLRYEVYNLDGRSVRWFYSESSGRKWTPLRVDADTCNFVRSTKEFDQGDTTTVLCGVNNRNKYGHVLSSKLVKSSNWFKSSVEIKHPRFEHGAIRDVRVKSAFIVVMVQNDKFDEHSSRVSLLVSRDAETFDESNFTTHVTNGKVVYLSSSPQSLQIAIQTSHGSRHHSTLSTVYATDSSGLRFREVASKVVSSAILPVDTAPGVWFVNVADNGAVGGPGDDHQKIGYHPNSRTQYTVDDGRTWRPLELVPGSDAAKECHPPECMLNILPPGEIGGDGRFVSGPTPGILMAVGNTGNALHPLDSEHHKTWLSRDGGSSWQVAIDERCSFSFGDYGNAILAIPWRLGKYYYFSVDQGKTFTKAEYPDNHEIMSGTVTTAQDGSSLRFVMESGNNKFITFDFGKVLSKKCGDGDMEDVDVRVAEGKATCLYGSRVKYSRRKQDAQCFVNNLFADLEPKIEKCECSNDDFECAPGFKPSEKTPEVCVPDSSQLAPLCKGSNKKLKLPDRQLITGDVCEFKGKKQADFITTKEIDCRNHGGDQPDQGDQKIAVKHSELDGTLQQYVYVPEGHNLDNDFTGENIIALTTKRSAYASEDGGLSFVKIDVGTVLSIISGAAPGSVVLTTDSEKIYVSNDGGNYFHPRDVPSEALGGIGKLEFDKENPDKFMWFGCHDGRARCSTYTAWVTEDNGKSFTELKRDVSQCSFIGLAANKTETIFCQVRGDDGWELQTSTDRFKTSETPFKNIVGYAPSGAFVVVATIVDTKNKAGKAVHALSAKVTTDGSTWADADFPSDLATDVQQAYTVLDSTTHSIFVLLTVSMEAGREYGALLKSNSNGTSYVLSLEDVNRNTRGFADFDRMDLLEGTLIANQVANPGGARKQLRTLISYNDGGEWSRLRAPAKDSKGNSYGCSPGSADCSLHLHGFTERPDVRDSLSSTGAVGILIGCGNVGSYLEPEDSDNTATFLSDDGGVTWREVAKGPSMWEFGDYGSVVVVVPKRATSELQYSLDQGKSWQTYKFADHDIEVADLATSTRDTSMKFVLWALGSNTEAYTVDFSDLWDTQCSLDLEHPDSDDFDYWAPPYTGCMFGHQAQYLRKSTGTACFVGEAPLKDGFKVLKNCSCTRQDYECDYNFYRDPADNTCKLVEGLSPQDRKEQLCAKPGAFEYFRPTGYRKLPLSTCSGGVNYENTRPEPCPGKEHEFREHYGYSVGGGKILLIFGIPMLIFLASTWFVYERGVRRNGGFRRLGQIRLGDEADLIEDDNVDVVVNKVVKGGIVVAAGIYAAFKVVWRLDQALFSKVASLFRRDRSQFVRVPDDDFFGEFNDQDSLVASNYDEFEIPDDDMAGAQEVDERLFGLDDEE
ncbi:vacuolar protein sorting/targeting protein VPS10 [Diutina catenulata]